MITPDFISCILIDKSEKEPLYLLLRRCGSLKGTWQMVTGKIEEDEAAFIAAKREVQEETGLTLTELFSADAIEAFYLPHMDKICFSVAFVSFVKRQPVSLSPSEHDAYEWVSFDEAVKRVVWSEQRRILKLVHKNFVLNAPSVLLRIPETREAIEPAF